MLKYQTVTQFLKRVTSFTLLSEMAMRCHYFFRNLNSLKRFLYFHFINMIYSSIMKRILVLILLLFGFQRCQNSPNKQTGQNINQETATKFDSIINHETRPIDVKYDTYCNSRFKFCIDYPGGVLFPQGESDNRDGQVFKSKDAENSLTVYWDSRDTIGLKTSILEAAYNDDTIGNFSGHLKKVITYKKLGNDYYVVSGYEEGKIFYQKTISSDNQLYTCYLKYKETEKEYYAKVAERIFTSFKSDNAKSL